MTRNERARFIAGALVIVFGVGAIVAAVIAFGSRSHSGSAVAAPLRRVLRGATPANAPFAGLTETRVLVGTRCMRVVVADSETERERGLMDRRDLGPYDGMLFVSPSSTTDQFTMSGTLVPLDIGWYDRNGAPGGTAHMVPCAGDVAHCPLYHSQRAWRFAIETLQQRLPAGGLSSC